MKYFTDPKLLPSTRVISLDTEYSDLNVRTASLLSISVGVNPDLAGVFLPHDLGAIKSKLTTAEVIFTQNGKVDWYMLNKAGISLDRSKFIDTMLMEHLIDENLSHSLGDMAVRHFQDDYKSSFWGQYSTYEEAPRQAQLEYELRDAVYTLRLGKLFYDSVPNKSLIEHVHRLYWALFDTEIEGLRVDIDLIQRTKREMGTKIRTFLPALRDSFSGACNEWELTEWSREIQKRKTDKFKSLVRRPNFNFGSDSQIRWLLFDHLGLRTENKTKGGLPKTDFDTIKSLSETCEDLVPLVEYKEIKNIYATFVEGLEDKIEVGRIYPSFSVNGTTTGRISHSGPNMGNIPTDGPIRNFFIPECGNRIIGADYSQLEVVVEANLTDDSQLLKIINDGASKHDITAQGLSISRESAKTLNFALQYGAGVRKVSTILSCSSAEAQDIFDRYWKLYSGVKSLKDKTTKEIQDKGQVTNLFGRTRHFPKPKNHWEAEKQYRQGYNFLIQGVGADMCNMAVYRVHEFLKSNNYGRLWFSVHDEIVCEVSTDYTDASISGIVQCMEGVNKYVNFKYPVHTKPYGPFPSWRKA